MELRAENLTCRRGARIPFAPVSFTLEPGQALILRGPNGSGKTTLLRALAGLLRFETGTVNHGDRPLDPGDGAVAYSGHLDAVKAPLTVAENLAFWAELHGHADLPKVLADFDLTGLADTPAGRLSAGQKRRLGLARLPLTGAQIWLMDEPTVSLDTQNAEAVARQVMRHLASGGLAIIATHIPLDLPGEALTLSPPPRQTAHDPFLASLPA